MIESGFGYFASLLLIAGLVSTTERIYNKSFFFKYIPTPVILYLGCMVLATFDFWKGDQIGPTSSTIRNYLIPAMIFIMLLRCDVRKILKLGPRMLIGFFSATFTIMIGFVVMFYFMKDGFPADSWRAWGALTGSWIGGTANMVAIQEALQVSEGAMGNILIVDNVNYSIWVILLLATVPLAHAFNKFTKSDTSLIDTLGEQLGDLDKGARTKIETSDVAILCGLGFAVSAFASYAAGPSSEWCMAQFGKSDFFAVNTLRIVYATALGIIFAMTPVGKIPGSSQISVTMLYLMIGLISSRANFKELADAPYYLLAGFVVLGIHALLMAILAKIFRLDLFTCATASLANIGAVAAAPIIAAAYKEALVPIGVLMALMGYVVGTFGGLFVAQILQSISLM